MKQQWRALTARGHNNKTDKSGQREVQIRQIYRYWTVSKIPSAADKRAERDISGKVAER